MGRENYQVKRIHTALFSFVLCLLLLLNVVYVPGEQAVSAASRPLVVMLDPGHGGVDSGAVRPLKNPTDYELIFNEKLAAACRAELATYDNVLVYLTRVGNVDISTQARATYAKRMEADLFVSFHINAEDGSSANGAEIYVPNGNYKPAMAVEARALAEKILEGFGALELPGYGLSGNRLKIRGVKARSVQTDLRLFYPDGSAGDYYEVIRLGVQNEIPSMIIEHAFISNPADVAMLRDDAVLEKLGQATATAIAKQYGLKKTGNSLPQPELKMQTTAVTLGGVREGAIYNIGDAPFTLTASGGNGTGEYIFNSNNPKVIRIEGNQAYIVGAGEVKLSVTRYEDGEYAPRTVASRTSVEVVGVETQLKLAVADNYRTEDGKQNVVLTCTPEEGTDNGAVPSGTVTFYQGENKLGTAKFGEDGRCTFVASNLEPGAYTFSASYEKGNFDGFTMEDSAPVSYGVEVTQPTPTPVETAGPADGSTPGTPSEVVSGDRNSGNGFLDLLSNQVVIIILAIAAGLVLIAIIILIVCRFRP